MRTLPILTFTFSIVLAGAAGAQTAAPDASAAAPEPPPKLICVRGQAETGSHFGASKVCHTQGEWAIIHDESGRMLERYDALQNKQAPASGR